MKAPKEVRDAVRDRANELQAERVQPWNRNNDNALKLGKKEMVLRQWLADSEDE